MTGKHRAPERRRRTVAERIGAAAATVEPGARITVRVTSLEVEAAKLRLITDRNLGRNTPLWVRRLAAAKDD